jgi:hypothetical protein
VRRCLLAAVHLLRCPFLACYPRSARQTVSSAAHEIHADCVMSGFLVEACAEEKVDEIGIADVSLQATDCSQLWFAQRAHSFLLLV